MDNDTLTTIVITILMIILFTPHVAQIISDVMVEYKKNKWIDETIAYDRSTYPNEYYTLTREVAEKFYEFCCDGEKVYQQYVKGVILEQAIDLIRLAEHEHDVSMIASNDIKTMCNLYYKIFQFVLRYNPHFYEKFHDGLYYTDMNNGGYYDFLVSILNRFSIGYRCDTYSAYIIYFTCVINAFNAYIISIEPKKSMKLQELSNMAKMINAVIQEMMNHSFPEHRGKIEFYTEEMAETPVYINEFARLIRQYDPEVYYDTSQWQANES